MCVAVFDLGGTLMEYTGMPESWITFYEQGLQAVNCHFRCGTAPADIVRSVEILRSWNPRVMAREKEVSPEHIFAEAVSHWNTQPLAYECMEVFFHSLNLRVQIYPDAIPCLTWLREKGIRIAALTDLPSGMPDEIFIKDIQGLLPYIDYYVSSAVCGYRKPNRHGLDMIAEHFHTPAAELVLFGDEEKDKLTAANVGCRFVEVRRKGQEAFDLRKLVERQIIIAHTMQYTSGERVTSSWSLRNYCENVYPAYQRIYNDCFADMRRALHLTPICCCGSRAALLSKARNIFILEAGGELAGSVAIYGNEIDDLFVAKHLQGKGYGRGLLRFAVARMQQRGIEPITLHVADWNQRAVKMYQKNGFYIAATEIV